MPTREESSAGPSMTTCAPRWSQTPSAWPSPAGARLQPNSTIMHSDHGSQFTSRALGQRLHAAGLLGSMGSIGDCYDNSMIKSFWGTMHLRATRLTDLGDPRRACQHDIRMVSVLVQPQAAPFQYRNAQPTGLRSPPHRPRSRSLAPHRRCPVPGANLGVGQEADVLGRDRRRAARHVPRPRPREPDRYRRSRLARAPGPARGGARGGGRRRRRRRTTRASTLILAVLLETDAAASGGRGDEAPDRALRITLI